MKSKKKTKNEKSSLSSFLREKRIANGLSQADVAEFCRYGSSQFISNWERGISSPPVSTLRKLCGLYKINQDEMFDKLLTFTINEVTSDLKHKFYRKSS